MGIWKESNKTSEYDGLEKDFPPDLYPSKSIY